MVAYSHLLISVVAVIALVWAKISSCDERLQTHHAIKHIRSKQTLRSILDELNDRRDQQLIRTLLETSDAMTNKQLSINPNQVADNGTHNNHDDNDDAGDDYDDDDRLMDDLYSASGHKIESRTNNNDNNIVRPMAKQSDAMTPNEEKRKEFNRYVRRAVCNYFKRREFKFSAIGDRYNLMKDANQEQETPEYGVKLQNEINSSRDLAMYLHNQALQLEQSYQSSQSKSMSSSLSSSSLASDMMEQQPHDDNFSRSTKSHHSRATRLLKDLKSKTLSLASSRSSNIEGLITGAPSIDLTTIASTKITQSTTNRPMENERKKTYINLQMEDVIIDLDQLKMYIYTKDDRGVVEPRLKPEVLTDKEATVKFPLDLNDMSVAISVHGLWNSYRDNHQQQLKDSLLNYYDIVILFDWSIYSGPLLFFRAAASTLNFGQLLGSHLLQLIELKGLALHNVHLLGYSLGAHILSYVSKYITSESGQIVERITAFDPALPMFRTKGLAKSDAKLIQVIHTDAGMFGQSKQLGHYDYYPNGGNKQPGCQDKSFVLLGDHTCDHGRSVSLFTYTIAQHEDSNHCQFVGYPCDTYKKYLDGLCYKCLPVDDIDNPQCQHISYKPEMGDKSLEEHKRLFFVSGKPDEGFCTPNYRVKLHFAKIIRQVRETKGAPILHVSFNNRQEIDRVFKMDFNVSVFDSTASKLLVITGPPMLIDNVEIWDDNTGKDVYMLEIDYLSHSKKVIREKYSSRLWFQRENTTNKHNVYGLVKPDWHGDRKQTTILD